MITGLRVPFLDLARSYRRHRAEIDGAVARVLAGGWYILGAELEAFEAEFAAYCETRFAIGVNSGTDALQLALRAAGVGPGHAVITVPNTAVPTVCAIAATGATPVLVDIDPSTHTLDVDRLRAALRSWDHPGAPRAIVPVHLCGRIADMAGIGEVARQHGLVVVEDAAQAHGAEIRGRKAGSLGDLGCFSFYPTKNLGALGDAGMVVTDDEGLARRVRMLRNYGETAKYRSRIAGFNSRLDEIQAAVLRVKLGHLDAGNARRRELARLYDKLLTPTPLRLPAEAEAGRHVHHLYVVRHPRRDELRRHLEDRGVGTSIHYPTPIHLQEAYADLAHRPGDFPEAERAAREVLSLPLYPELADEEVRLVCEAIREFFGVGPSDARAEVRAS